MGTRGKKRQAPAGATDISADGTPPLLYTNPENALGRVLRKMYPGGVEEYVSVVGTNAFMDFVESRKSKS